MNDVSQNAKVDLGAMRAANERLLLRLIWEQPETTRADLSRRTGLSASTVSGIVSRFEQDRWVSVLQSTTSSGGRPPMLLRFDATQRHIVGVEMGASHLTVVLASTDGRVITSIERALDTRDDPRGTLDTAAQMVRECVARTSYKGRLLGLGIAVPSPIDSRAPDRVSPMILPSWRDVDLAKELHARLGLPVSVENDANAGALAERWFGAGGDHFTYVKVGTGIGSGHIMNGTLYRGAGGIAGELGHLSIDPSGPVCVCGNRGCLNVVLGTPRLLELARQRCSGEAPASARALAREAREGAPWAVELVSDVGERLGIGVAGLLNLMNPSRVVLGGDLVTAGPVFLDAVRSSARSRSLLFSNHQAELTATSLGSTAIALGAATLPLHAAFEDHTRMAGVHLGAEA